ncbi:hypothetical protein Golomagni_06291 [Golovinomyces magnicellulatus]|nr:hypothetical protein Golomagni_06291 [Golovinomyces magnicellulatus]
MTKTSLKRTFSSGKALNGNNTNGHSANGASDLEGLDLGTPTGPPKVVNLASAAHLSPGWEKGYNNLLVRSEGILYEDSQLQIGIRSEYRGQMACLIAYFRNKNPGPISSFTTTLDLDESEKLNLTWDVKDLPESNLAPGSQTQQVFMFEAKRAFEKSPTMRVSYLAGALQAVTLKLPVTMHKFMDPADLSAEDFFKRWKQIGTGPREAQAIFGLSNKSNGTELTSDFVRNVVQGFRWGVLDRVDPNPKNIVGASVLHTSKGGKFGCLLRLEPNYDNQMIRLTLRVTDDSVPSVLLKLMQDRISAGQSTISDQSEMMSREEISDAFGNVLVT